MKSEEQKIKDSENQNFGYCDCCEKIGRLFGVHFAGFSSRFLCLVCFDITLANREKPERRITVEENFLTVNSFLHAYLQHEEMVSKGQVWTGNKFEFSGNEHNTINAQETKQEG